MGKNQDIVVVIVVLTIILLLLVSFVILILFIKQGRVYKERRRKEAFTNYIFLIPDNLKDLFIESLRAFEDYSRLSGYEVKFSFDNSGKDRLGFKFTITENPNNISKDEIRTDIKEFLDKVQKGEKFDDLPIVINPFEHQMVLY